MIWANNTKWASGYLFGCGKANFDPLAKGNLYYLLFITALFLVWTAGHMDSHKSLGP